MPNLLSQIIHTLTEARSQASRVVNHIMVVAYWRVGERIVEEEQQGAHRAEYGANLIGYLSKHLTLHLGKGFDPSNLSNMRRFYRLFPNFDAVRQELSWTHYRSLLRVENPQARQFYLDEAIANGWGTRALDRQINSLYHERLLSSRDQASVFVEMQANTAPLQPRDILKDPYVLEFLQLKENRRYLEAELEQALIDQLQNFLLELGKGFAFVARQQRISTETKHFYVDAASFLPRDISSISLRRRNCVQNWNANANISNNKTNLEPCIQQCMSRAFAAYPLARSLRVHVI